MRLTKTHAEQTPLDSCNFSFFSPQWVGNSHQTFIDKFVSIQSELIQQSNLYGCEVLRHVEIVSDFGDGVSHWQRELGEADGYTKNQYGQATGKAFCWKNENDETAFGVIVIPDDIAEAFLNDNPLAAGVIAHELAHIHDDSLFLKYFGTEEKIQPENLQSYLSYIARSTWSEYFADRTAYRYFKGQFIEACQQLCLERTNGAINEMEKVFMNRGLSPNGRYIWNAVISEASAVANQLGRTLGHLHAAEDSDQREFEDFYLKIAEFGPEWTTHVKDIGSVLRTCRGQRFPTKSILSSLENLVLTGISLFGVFPTQVPGDIHIKIR